MKSVSVKHQASFLAQCGANMKIRMGFVSNSSSSSFTMVGVRLDDSDLVDVADGLKTLLGDSDGKRSPSEMLRDLCKGYGSNIRLHSIEGIDGCILGIEFGGSDCYDIDEMPISRVIEMSEKVSEFLKKIGIEGAPSLFSGATYC